jgi:hypothetical protein
MKSVVFVSAALPLSSSYPFTDVIVINTDNGNCGDAGGKSVGTRGSANGNLNQGISKGANLGLCYKNGAGGGDPISDLKLLIADNQQDWQGQCSTLGDGWGLASLNFGANGDLNQGHNGKYISLCMKIDSNHQNAITGLYVQSDEHCPSGFQVVSSNNGDNNLNQHGHSKGKNVFLCAQKVSCDPIDEQIIGYWNGLMEYKAGQIITHSVGISEHHSTTWTHTVSDSITKSNTRVQIDATGSTSQLSTHSNTVSNVVTNAISHDLNEGYTTSRTLTKNGFGWQYATNVPTTCGITDTIFSTEMVLSKDSNKYPCCYPDRFADLDDASKCLTVADILPGGEDRKCSAQDCQKPGESGRRRRCAMKAEGLDLDGAEVV